MSGVVLLIDYDRDGWPDIYFTNAPTLEMALKGEKARSALYHNNRDDTFSDVTDKAGIADPCWAIGGAVGDYNNDAGLTSIRPAWAETLSTGITERAPSPTLLLRRE